MASSTLLPIPGTRKADSQTWLRLKRPAVFWWIGRSETGGKVDNSRIDSKARAMKALPDTGFAAVTGAFVGPERVQQFADFLLKLQNGSPFGIVADEIF